MQAVQCRDSVIAMAKKVELTLALAYPQDQEKMWWTGTILTDLIPKDKTLKKFWLEIKDVEDATQHIGLTTSTLTSDNYRRTFVMIASEGWKQEVSDAADE